MSDDAAIVKEFLIESYENLDRLDQDLVVLEKEPANRETLASIFRTIHTIKGTSGFLAFNELEAVTHAGESLLSRLRDGLLPLNAEITTALLAMLDAVREMLKNIETSGKEGERNDQELIGSPARSASGQPCFACDSCEDRASGDAIRTTSTKSWRDSHQAWRCQSQRGKCRCRAPKSR